jgi:hypothetical protein
VRPLAPCPQCTIFWPCCEDGHTLTSRPLVHSSSSPRRTPSHLPSSPRRMPSHSFSSPHHGEQSHASTTSTSQSLSSPRSNITVSNRTHLQRAPANRSPHHVRTSPRAIARIYNEHQPIALLTTFEHHCEQSHASTTSTSQTIALLTTFEHHCEQSHASTTSTSQSLSSPRSNITVSNRTHLQRASPPFGQRLKCMISYKKFC